MLRGLWTTASIFTVTTQIFIGTRPHLEYWWTRGGGAHVSSQAWTRDPVCELCYGENWSQSWVMSSHSSVCVCVWCDRYYCEVQGPSFISTKVVLPFCVIGVTVNIVIGVVQRFVVEFMARSRQSNDAVIMQFYSFLCHLKQCWIKAQEAPRCTRLRVVYKSNIQTPFIHIEAVCNGWIKIPS